MKIAELILPVVEPVRADSADQRCVTLDNEHQPVRRPSLWPWTKRRHYVVSVSNDRGGKVAKREPFSVLVPPKGNVGYPVELKVSFTAWCLPSRAEEFSTWYDVKIGTEPAHRLEENFDTLARATVIDQFQDPKVVLGIDLTPIGQAVQTKLKELCRSLEFDVTVESRTAVLDWEAKAPPPIELKFEDYSNVVAIRTKELRLKFENIRPFLLNNGPTDLDEWGRWAVREAARAAIEKDSNKSYIDFLSDWPDIRARIKHCVGEFAGQIGYKVVALLNEPDTREYAALRELQVNIDNRTFKTKDANVDVKLSLFVTGRLRDLRRPAVRAAIRSHENIEKRLEDSLAAALQVDLHNIQANDFFLYFNLVPDRLERAAPVEDVARVRNKTVEAQLEERVRTVLDAWGVVGLADVGPDGDPAKVALKRGDSEVTAMLNDLRRDPFSIMGVDIPTAGTGYLTKYSFTFSVRGIDAATPDAYARLATLCDKSDTTAVRKQIQAALTEVLIANLHTFEASAIRYQDTQLREALEKWINLLVGRFAAREFGLLMEVRTLRRHSTIEEEHQQAIYKLKTDSEKGMLEESQRNLEAGRVGWMKSLAEIANDNSRTDEEKEAALRKIEEFVNQKATPPPLPKDRSPATLMEPILRAALAAQSSAPQLPGGKPPPLRTEKSDQASSTP